MGVSAEMTGIIELRRKEGCSCVIRNGSETRTFHERGVKDLYRLLNEEPSFLAGSIIADKVVGTAAASLMVLGGVRLLFAETISKPALELANAGGMAVEYDTVVPHIINRSNTDWCPLEKLCFDADTATECLERIAGFMAGNDKMKNSRTTGGSLSAL